MSDESRLRLYKTRIIKSFRWQKDIINPCAKYLGISNDEFEDILMDKLDMSSLESLHATYESSLHEELMLKLHVDLKFFWFVDVLNLISEEEATQLKVKLAKEVQYKHMTYDEAVEEGKKEFLDIIRK
ncbi:NiFe hydrogenase [Methanobrevibacter sp. 87.7]|uniref:DUF1959 family protein n=1 Tax=Methanobrevibacter sp. 87.7 TaxID=387957 RepID=UPI000B5124D7|nr:DUF1959 family protein [Methanobrevibacter sp. 87.7]OWT33531.1 NiFe hydrogenase [Methanobrevibacter sp. 87.7]